MFEHVFTQCVAAGLVAGHTQAVDSAFVEANVSLKRLCEKQPAGVPPPVLQVASEVGVEMPLAPPAALRTNPEHHRVASAHACYLRNGSGLLGRDRPQVRLLSNKTHYSPADPDARIFS